LYEVKTLLIAWLIGWYPTKLLICQDLPNNMIHQVGIKSLPQEWLWCETWCSDDEKPYAKTIDLVCTSHTSSEPFDGVWCYHVLCWRINILVQYHAKSIIGTDNIWHPFCFFFVLHDFNVLLLFHIFCYLKNFVWTPRQLLPRAGGKKALFWDLNIELCPNISLQRNMISTIGKKLVNLQGLPCMPLNLVNIGPETAENGWRVFVHPLNFHIGRHCQPYCMDFI